jgi:hypothetical protein
MRCAIYLKANRWDYAFEVADTLVRHAPQRLNGGSLALRLMT